LALTNILVESHSQVPAHAQIKDQIKFACLHQELKPGHALPSIRRLASQLNVGDGVVRRAYRELHEMGLLVTEGRKHVVGMPAVAAASKAGVVRASTEQCDRMLAWATANHLSAISLSRLLLRQALVREIASPSYLFIDICKLAAERSADKVSKAWGIRIAGVSVGDFTDRWSNNVGDVTAVLVNECLYEDVIEVVGEITPRVFSIRIRLDERLRRRISKLPMRSTVLIICSDEDFSRTGRAMLRHCEQLFGSRWRFQAKKVGEIPDLPRLIRTQRYRLFLFSPLVWEELPTRVKRMVAVAPAFSEPDPQSLEETRIAAGVLL
jgi:DNA-binding transcriptional regulator YhcF (GntR family)